MQVALLFACVTILNGCGGGGGSSASGALGAITTPANFTMPSAISTVPPQ